MLDLRKKIYIGVGVVVGIILAILLFVLIGGKDKGVAGDADKTGNGPTEYQPQGDVVDTVPKFFLPLVKENKEPVDADEVYIKNIAKTFVERFGTRSSLNDNTHIQDAEELATGKLLSWLKTQATSENSEYKGVTTKVVTSTVTKFSGGTAEVVLDVQQQISTQTEKKIEYKRGTATLVEQNGDWKVSGWFWD